MNVHINDSYIIPRRWYIRNGIVESIQSNVYDEFSVQVQSLFVSEMKLLSTFLRRTPISFQITCFSVYSDTRQLFVLTQIPPTVDIYYNIQSYISIYQQIYFCTVQILTVADSPVLVMSNSTSYQVHVGLSTGDSNYVLTYIKPKYERRRNIFTSLFPRVSTKILPDWRQPKKGA